MHPVSEGERLKVWLGEGYRNSMSGSPFFPGFPQLACVLKSYCRKGGACSGSLQMLFYPRIKCEMPHCIRSFHSKTGGGGNKEVKIRKEKEEVTLKEMEIQTQSKNMPPQSVLTYLLA